MTDVTPDDTNTAIEKLLLEAAELANAATAKLNEALRLAEQAKGETPMTQSPDWTYFRDNPTRSYCSRLATPAELEQIEFNGATLAPDYFVYAISRLRRDEPPLELKTLFVVLEPQQSDMDEAQCMAVWHSAEDGLLGGHVEGAR
jgi:hypothetical protein